jgi:hypothetical protein
MLLIFSSKEEGLRLIFSGKKQSEIPPKFEDKYQNRNNAGESASSIKASKIAQKAR